MRAQYNRWKSGVFNRIILENWFESTALPYLERQPAARAFVGDNLPSNLLRKVETRKFDSFFYHTEEQICVLLGYGIFCDIEGKMAFSFQEWKRRKRREPTNLEFLAKT